MSKINILIADDHKLIRETWSYILNSDSRFQVIAECGDAQEAVELAKAKCRCCSGLIPVQLPNGVAGFPLSISAREKRTPSALCWR